MHALVLPFVIGVLSRGSVPGRSTAVVSGCVVSRGPSSGGSRTRGRRRHSPGCSATVRGSMSRGSAAVRGSMSRGSAAVRGSMTGCSAAVRGSMPGGSAAVRGSMTRGSSTRRGPTTRCHVPGGSTSSRRSANRSRCTTTRRGVSRGSAPRGSSATGWRVSGSPTARSASSRSSPSLIGGSDSGGASPWCSTTGGSCSRCLVSWGVPIVGGDSWSQDWCLVSRSS